MLIVPKTLRDKRAIEKAGGKAHIVNIAAGPEDKGKYCMKDMTLLVMVRMGSRYGGLKQLDAVGPNGETIIDFSVYDAIRAGYNKVVFIIRKDFEKQFKQKVSNKYKNKIDVEIVYQDLNDLPGSFRCPNERLKPWGTGHAILAARNAISEPFVAINGDDFMGKSLRSYQ